MNMNKYIKEASETELLSYKLLLNMQVIDAQETLYLIAKQLNKIELRKSSDITGDLWTVEGRL